METWICCETTWKTIGAELDGVRFVAELCSLHVFPVECSGDQKDVGQDGQ